VYTVYNLPKSNRTEFLLRKKPIERHQTLREKILEMIRDAILKKGTVSLYQDAIQKVVQGETTYEEILNIADLEVMRKS